MKFFSDCSGECCVCLAGEFCLAGHGDDDFAPAPADVIIARLNNGKYPSRRQYMIDYLLEVYGLEYNDQT